MNTNNVDYNLHYPKIFGAVILFLIFGINLMNRNEKPREEFIYQIGTISYMSNINPFRPNSEPRPKDFYLQLHEYERVFELFTGTDTGDFSPRINKLDQLSIGDEIEIYFEETNKTKREYVNRVLQYLDKDGELIYLRSNADKNIGYFLIGISGILLMVGIYMKVKS
ncbi:hypothetical protein N9B82_00485 [Saprospiraceae bacterium]|nr:hypothetical protein [Saprospiraceae bacterium]